MPVGRCPFNHMFTRSVIRGGDGGSGVVVVVGGGGDFFCVCDAAARHGWGLYLLNGCLYRNARKANGEPVFNAEPPEGWPDGGGTQVMKDEAGRPANLYGRPVGAVIEVLVDHDEGTLSFRVNDGPLCEALKGFPKNAALRPCVWCVCDGDRIRFVTPYL